MAEALRDSDASHMVTERTLNFALCNQLRMRLCELRMRMRPALNYPNI